MLPELYLDDGEDFIIIAHRGASAYYPENTIAAFIGAVELQAMMIELDVQLSKDGVPVVFHDARLNHHSNGKGLLRNLALEELKKLDAGAWFDPKFAGEPIPTLEEVLKFASGIISLNIEIKTEAVTDDIDNGIEEECLELVHKYDMEDHVLFSSFDYRAVEHLKALESSMPVALLYNKELSGNYLPSALVREYRADAFNCGYRELDTEWLNDIQAYGIPVFIYTIDKKSHMKRLLSMKVSGIFTNKPDVLRSIVEQETRS